MEDFKLEIVKAKPGDTIIIKFPMEKYGADLDYIYHSFNSLKAVVPDGVKLMMIPCDWSVEVEHDNLH